MVADAASGTPLTPAAQRDVVARLRAALQAGEPDHEVQWIETHISHVLVARDFAYKFRKAVRLDFLDFTSLASRRHDCEEELRLNRRFAPELYLDVLPVTGAAAAPQFDGPGPVIDVALRMRAFDQGGLWDRLAAAGALQPAHIDALATTLAALHAQAPVADVSAGWGEPAQVRAGVRDDLDALAGWLTSDVERARLARLRRWEAVAGAELAPTMAARLRAGRVRECHGDLHLGNVAQIHGRTRVFDCIEFSAAFRWTDVVSDLAFMVMDLYLRGLPRLARRLVNGYFEASGDYDGVRMLRYYIVHRALVRAKVAGLRAVQQPGGSPTAAVRRHLAYALRCLGEKVPVLMITHGCSGSGKTTLSQGLLELAGAVRIRADVERKRLWGLAPLARSDAAQQRQLYGDAATRATYARLFELAASVLRSGCHVLLDATFLRRAQRDAARRFAAEHGVRCLLLDFDVDAATLRERVRRRAARDDDASDAGLAVLAEQLRTAEPLTAGERAESCRCGGGPPDGDAAAVLRALAAAPRG